MHRMLVFVLLIISTLAAWAMPEMPKVPEDEPFTDALDAESYDCYLTARRAETLPGNGMLQLRLESEGNTAGTRVTLSAKRIVVSTGEAKTLREWPTNVTVPTSFSLTVMRRKAALLLAFNNAIIFRGDVPRGEGTEGYVLPAAGWTVNECSAQALEPVVFADDFMRASEEKGGGAWTVVSGRWSLKSAWDKDPWGNKDSFNNTNYAQNPFAWVGMNPAGVALCTVGKPFWEDYTFATSVCPAPAGAVGVAVNLADATHGLLLRWTPANDRSAAGNALALYRINGDERTLLAQSRGGYLPGQWYRLTVFSTLDGVRVLIDGAERLTGKDSTCWRGGIGLYAEGPNGSVFDDLTVYSRQLNTDLMADQQLTRLSKRILDDPLMQKWLSDWAPFPGQPAAKVGMREFYGNHRIAAVLVPRPDATGACWLGLSGDGKALVSGCRAVIERTADGKGTVYTLYHGSTQLATATKEALEPGDEYSLRFGRVGTRYTLEVDGEPVVSAVDPQAPDGRLPFVRAEGCFTDLRDLVAGGNNVRDYFFTEEPVDWIGEGAWESSVRWACDPKWSFMSGWSHGLAAFWQKQVYTGDQSMEAYVGVKMEYPRAREPYERRFRDLGIAICTDGRNPRTGYTAILGAPDERGNPNRRSVLLRNGVVVGTAPINLPDRDTAHRDWFQLALRKNGATVEFRVNGALAASFTDPEPLEGGVPVVWTRNNGITLGRVRLTYVQAPTPRTTPQVTLGKLLYPGWKTDSPTLDYPEWVNLGQPFTLDFPAAGSSSGNPVQVQAEPVIAPAGEVAPVITGTHITLTPKKLGDHWYRVTAADGALVSPEAHAIIPVFDPALGRDDSHTLVKYRFAEGEGKIVHDEGVLGEKADISILTPSATRWQPGQGLTLVTATNLMSKPLVGKLMSLSTKQTGTFECWVSLSTLYPMSDNGGTKWEGTIFAWDAWSNNTLRRNFAVGFHSHTMLLAAGPGAILKSEMPTTLQIPNFRPDLLHLVITFTGMQTAVYFNGSKVFEGQFNWRTDQWSRDAFIFLGNKMEDNRYVLGTYYLLAVHDVALTPAQVLRHYQAGPSAK